MNEKWVFISVQKANLFALNFASSEKYNSVKKQPSELSENIAVFAVKKELKVESEK
jgi:hypothetical protein